MLKMIFFVILLRSQAKNRSFFIKLLNYNCKFVWFSKAECETKPILDKQLTLNYVKFIEKCA